MRVSADNRATRFAKMLARDPKTGKDVNWNSISTKVEGKLGYTIDEDSGRMKLFFSPVGEAFFYGSGKGLITTQVVTNPAGGSVPTGSSLIRVKSTADIEVGDDLIVGELGSTRDANDLKEIASNKEEFFVVAVDAAQNLITLNKPLAMAHKSGEAIYCTHRTKRVLEPDITSGANTIPVGATKISVKIPVNSVLGMAYDTKVIRIGDEEVAIAGYNTNVVTLASGLTKIHTSGETVSWIQYPSRPYENHPIAPWMGERIFNTDKKSEWQVKRVVGMTRANDKTEELDGSYIKSTFTDGRIKQVGQPKDWWTKDSVLQNGEGTTGYDADEKGDGAYDQRVSTKTNPLDAAHPFGGVRDDSAPSKTLVEFPNLQVTKADGTKVTGEKANIIGRQDTAQSYAAVDKDTLRSRYTDESVNINLRKAVKKVAKPVSPVKPAGE